MKRLLATVILASSWSVTTGAYACRDAHRTHEERLAVSRTALVARVSAVAIPAIEEDGYEELRDFPLVVTSPRTVRLTVMKSLKGKSPRVFEIVATECNGSTHAEAGSLLYVYKIHGDWRLSPAPPLFAALEVGT